MKTQKQKLLEAFKNGERLTMLDMLIKYGVGNHTARISELRQDGHAIQMKLTRIKSGGVSKDIGLYFMITKRTRRK